MSSIYPRYNFEVCFPTIDREQVTIGVTSTVYYSDKDGNPAKFKCVAAEHYTDSSNVNLRKLYDRFQNDCSKVINGALNDLK